MAAQDEGEPQDQHRATCSGQEEASMLFHPQQAIKANQEYCHSRQDVPCSQMKNKILMLPPHVDAQEEEEQEIRDDAPGVPDQQSRGRHESQQRNAEGEQSCYDGNHK